LWPGFVSDLAAMWPNADTVSEVELVLLADVLRAMDRLRTIGQELAKTGPVVTGSRKQVRPHPLLRVEAELRGEVRRGFEKLGLTGWHARNYRVDAAGSFAAAAGKGSEMLRAAPGQLGRPSLADSCRPSRSAGAGATVRRRFIAVLFFGGRLRLLPVPSRHPAPGAGLGR
jgi:hypothetical protein